MESSQSKEEDRLYNKGINYINKIVNYLSYIKLYYDFEKLKMLLLTKDELSLFNFTSKPIISLDTSISKMTKVLEDSGDEYKVLYDIYKYFEKIEKKNMKELSDIEKKLISFLDYDLQVELGDKFNCTSIFDNVDEDKNIF